jgi:glycine/D-amino acid oxidase-like deaminating enzyme
VDFADGPSGFDDVRQVERTLGELGARCEPLNRAQFAQRFPQWRIGDDGIALYSPDAGVLFASKCVAAAVRTARRLGATVRENEKVASIAVDGSAVRVTTAKGAYQAKRVVLTAGS